MAFSGQFQVYYVCHYYYFYAIAHPYYHAYFTYSILRISRRDAFAMPGRCRFFIAISARYFLHAAVRFSNLICKGNTPHHLLIERT